MTVDSVAPGLGPVLLGPDQWHERTRRRSYAVAGQVWSEGLGVSVIAAVVWLLWSPQVRAVGHFPQMAVWVLEVAGIATPEGGLR